MSQPNEIDVAAEELRAQLHRALLIARMVSRRTGVARHVGRGARAVPRASTGLDRHTGRAARSAAVLAARWPREAAAARWAAATVTRERAQQHSTEQGVPGDTARSSNQHSENHQVVAERESVAWDERVRSAGVEPDQVREDVRRESAERDPRPEPDPGSEPEPRSGPDVQPAPRPSADAGPEARAVNRPAAGAAVGEELVTEYLAEAYTERALDDLDNPPAPAAEPTVGDLIGASELRGGQLAPGDSDVGAAPGHGVDTTVDPELDPAFDPGRDSYHPGAGRGTDEGVGW